MTDASAELCIHISSHLELWCLYLKEAEGEFSYASVGYNCKTCRRQGP